MMLLRKYFPQPDSHQTEQLNRFAAAIRDWNQRINLVSRKDIDFLEERHILHSLSIAKLFSFKAGTHLLDAGTGGGFPGIPLAIFFPEAHFTLQDATGKKIRAVDAMVSELGLTNVNTRHGRLEETRETFDFITSRALGSLIPSFHLMKDKLKPDSFNEFPNGILYLKGGHFEDELREIPWDHEVFELSDIFQESFFDTKKLVYLHR